MSGATQSPSLVQVVLQLAVVLLQLNPPVQVEETGAAQAPAPVQCEIGVNVELPLGQEALPQATLVPAFWHLPAPSQLPVKPQGGFVAQRPCGSRPFEGTFAQLPALPAMLQAWQVVHELELQQTPSTQLLPVKQSVLTVQLCPSRFLVPQRLVLGSQMSGERQSASIAQAALQAVLPLQT